MLLARRDLASSGPSGVAVRRAKVARARDKVRQDWALVYRLYHQQLDSVLESSDNVC